ncbi:MAG: hypothetical protein IJ637_02950 [Prevotella sp.]|nr:hypothetical protein [Prevotella sp.]
MESADQTCCLLPRAWAEEPCRYFAATEKVLMAAGFEQAFARLRSRDARMGVRLQLTALLGSKGSYYRYKHGERLLTEEQQRLVAETFREHGYDGPLEYDRYIETYLFNKAIPSNSYEK